MNTPLPSDDLDPWQSWVGRSELRDDRIGAAPLAALAAMLDRDLPEPSPGTEVAPLAHWLYTLPTTRQSALGPDGHARRGGFLPPVPLPRRMWAGGRIEFLAPLCVGDEIHRTSRILRIDVKHGRSGRLVFVAVRHEITNARGLALVEEQDIVFRDAPSPASVPTAPTPAPGDASFMREIVPDPVLLFRYSALTFNAHRIHYDRRFCEEVEGYPGLVVHGPLLATLLVDLLRRERPHARLKRFTFTALRPTFDLHPFQVCGRDDGTSVFQLWSRDHEGFLTLRAEAHTE